MVELPLGSGSLSAIAVGADAVWVENEVERTLVRIDAASGEISDEIELGLGGDLGGLAATDDGVWMGLGEALVRIDPATMEIVAEVPLPDEPEPDGVAAGPGGVWVATQDGQVFQVDAATDEILVEVPAGGQFAEMAVSDDEGWRITSDGATEVQRIDAGSGEVTTVDLSQHGEVSGDEPSLEHVTTAGDTAWVVRTASSVPSCAACPTGTQGPSSVPRWA